MSETAEEKLIRIRYHHIKPEDMYSLVTAGDVLRYLRKEIYYLKEKVALFVDHDIRKYSWKTQQMCYEVFLKTIEEMIL